MIRHDVLLRGCFFIFFILSCGTESMESDSSRPKAPPFDPLPSKPHINHLSIRHPLHNIHVMSFRGSPIQAPNCLYNTRAKLNICAAAPSSKFSEIENRLDINLTQTKLDVNGTNLGPVNFACLNVVGGANPANLFVVGASVPVNQSTNCFANFVCLKESGLLEVNAGAQVCQPGLKTEIAVTYNAKDHKFGFYLKNTTTPDDVTIKFTVIDGQLLVEFVSSKHTEATTTIDSTVISLKIKDMDSMIESLKKHFKGGQPC